MADKEKAGFEEMTKQLQKTEISENQPCLVMSINMNGPGTAENRRELLKKLLQSKPLAITFCQELPGKFKELIQDSCKHLENKPEAAVIWSTAYFSDFKELKTTDREIIKIRDKINETEGATASKFLSQIVMVKLTPKCQPTESTLAVSFHGRHNNITKDKKHEVFSSLLKFLHKVIEKEGILSYIIGGDFNFNTLEVQNLPDKVVVHHYKLTSRLEMKRKKNNKFIPYKDNFIYYPEDILKVNQIQAIDLEKIKPPVETQVSNNEFLDHDPIMGRLEIFKNQNSEKSSQSTGIKSPESGKIHQSGESSQSTEKSSRARNQLEKARNQLERARNRLERARNQLERARNQLERARNQLERARNRLERARLSQIPFQLTTFTSVSTLKIL